MTSLQEALKESGVVQQVEELEAQRKASEVAANSGIAQRRWWQNFRLSLTRFEIPVLLVVRCDRWEEGLKYIREHNLNRTTTRCKDETEARDQVRRAVVGWYSADTPKSTEPENGSLIYWRIY